MIRLVSLAPWRFPALRQTYGASSLALAALLCGCASDGQFPSLAKRPAELVAEGRIARSVLPLPDDIPGRVAALIEAGRSAQARFEARRAATASAVAAAAGAERASDAWSKATVALADLSAARSETAVPLAELDQLYVAQRVGGGDGNAIAAARDQMTAWVADEDAVLAGLEGRLKN
jgi:hypothetical protein